MTEITFTLEQLKKLIERKTKQISKLQIELHDLTVRLKNECPHENVNDVSTYESGDYFNYAMTRHKHVCQLCGTVIDESTEIRSWR